ncbi:hypothetical protein BDZ94DRAFT_1313327 [Collybia nuda]|uniref:Uncharacterized protein n=1 Tax=Collybia nuda TaxID=64659 RepID=A0A9P5XX76_9AGAR|nr:hypothetical protein BDZ94DRAFT_1313327 [Collybia nuda]
MVMVSRLTFLATTAALFGGALGEFAITNPSSNSWWVAGSQNVLTWNCKETTLQTFTALIANKDPKVLVAPMAFIGIINNFDCSKTITQDQANQAAGTGYTIQLANPLNSTEVYVTSEEFEIKPLGSAYPATMAPSGTGTSGNSTSSTGSSNSSAPANSNAASSSTPFSFGFAAIGAILGLVVA